MSIQEGLDKVGEDGFHDDNYDNDEAVPKFIIGSGEHVGQRTTDENEDMNVPIGCTTRTRTMTKKGKEYQISMLFEKRKKLHARIMRKSKLIDDLMYSSSNIITVKEEIQQLSDQFNMLIETHNEYLKLLPPEALEHEEDWFDRIDENVCTHKHKIHNWIRTCEVDDRKSEKSGSSKRSSSKSSHKSSDRG